MAHKRLFRKSNNEKNSSTQENQSRPRVEGQTRYVLDATDDIVLIDFDGEDGRAPSHYFEDEWPDPKNHLFSPVLFSVPEILSWFCK